LSDEKVLRRFVSDAGLEPVDVFDVESPFVYPDLDSAVRGLNSSGVAVRVLPHPSRPVLYEPHIRDARDYVRLAESVNGPIPPRVDFAYIWGHAPEELQRWQPDVSIVNLETSVTASEDAWPGRGIHCRMSPHNIGSLTAARVDCCCLANNRVLDRGYAGLSESRAGAAAAAKRATSADAEWLCSLENSLGAGFDTRVRLLADNSMLAQRR
jgi:hypothetical protein